MTPYQAEHLSNFGKLLMLGGAVWGISRAAPSLARPALCFGVGAACWYAGRRMLRETSVSVSAVGYLGGDQAGEETGSVIDVTPERVTTTLV
ncbi:MAG: hypothetical protein OSA97_01445 [Nevskia sp.]|nr:hypothetical protein [Nevskia sp.]